jgi:hypothetical protein
MLLSLLSWSSSVQFLHSAQACCLSLRHKSLRVNVAFSILRFAHSLFSISTEGVHFKYLYLLLLHTVFGGNVES